MNVDHATRTNLALCSAKNLAANPTSVNWVRYAPGVKTRRSVVQRRRHMERQCRLSATSSISPAARSVTATLNVHFESSHQRRPPPIITTASTRPLSPRRICAIAYDTADGKWQLGAWVKNLENTAVIVGAQSNAITAGDKSAVNDVMAPPAHVGRELRPRSSEAETSPRL